MQERLTGLAGEFKGYHLATVALESFRLPFTMNSNSEKHHKISRDTLNGQCLW